MLDQKDYIIGEADSLFSQYGIKSVTMDDISRHLGMSKKTLYQQFADKNDLVTTVIEKKLEVQKCMMDQCCKESENAVHEVFHAVHHMQEILSKTNANVFYDLQKYHPVAWQKFRTFREKQLHSVISTNLKRGINEGLYRTDFHLDILTSMRLLQIDMVFVQNQFPTKYSLSQVMTELTEHFLYGICTLKGHKLINKYKSISEDE